MSDPVLVLRGALDKATEGPWAVDVVHEDADSGGDPNVPDEYWTLEISAGDESLLYSATLDDPTDDAHLIVAARNLLPVLLDEVEALRKVVDGVKALPAEWSAQADQIERARGAIAEHRYRIIVRRNLAAELARLLAVLDKEDQ